jgi:hypothetical protein
MRYLGLRGGGKYGPRRSRLMLRRNFGVGGRTYPRSRRSFEDQSVTAPSRLQSFGLALVIVGCQYARANALRIARLIAQTITLRTIDGDGLEHFV